MTGTSPAGSDATNPAPRVSVIVPVLNARRFLEPVMGSILAALDRCPGELIVVDNGSTDGSVELIEERWGSRASIHRLPGPTIGGVRNFGARLARADTLSFIDSDCVVPPEYFVNALAVLDRTGACATGSPYALPDDPHWVEAAWHRIHDAPGDRDVSYLPAGNFLCRRAAYEAVGGFDEQIVTGEDAELGQRLVTAGFRIRQSGEVIAVHLGNPKSLGHFFRKQRWHGLGMFGTFRNHWLDRPVIMTFLHLLASVAAVAALLGGPGGIVARIGLALVLAFSVPGITMAYRAIRTRRRVPVLAGTLLYHIYYDARLAALLLLPSERKRRRQRLTSGARG